MANIIGDLVYRITGDTSKLDKSLKKSDAEVKKAGKGIGALGGAITKLGGAIIASFAVQRIISFGKEAIKAASAAAETANKFAVTFRDISLTAEQSTNRLANTYKLAKSEVQSLLASTGDLLTGFGFTQTEALATAEQVLALGSDLASFQNIAGGTEEVVRRLNAALTGETEGLKSLGIVVRQDSTQFKDLVKSIQDSTGVSDQLAKSQAILQTALSQSKNAVGDTLRTQTEYANQVRILQSNIKSISEEIGRTFIPAAKKAVGFLNEIFEARNVKKESPLTQFAEDLKELTNADLDKKISDIGKTLGVVAGLELSFQDKLNDPKLTKEKRKALQQELDDAKKRYDFLFKQEKVLENEKKRRQQNEAANAKDEQDRLTKEQDERLKKEQDAADKRKQQELDILKTISDGEANLRRERELNQVTEESQSEQIKALYLSALNEAANLFGDTDAFVEKIKQKFALIKEDAKVVKKELSFEEKAETVLGIANALAPLAEIFAEDKSEEIKTLLVAAEQLATAIATGNPADWIKLAATVINGIVEIYKKNEAALDGVEEGIDTLSESMKDYVENLRDSLLNDAIDIWADYAKAVLREQSGLDELLEKQASIRLAKEERARNEELNVLKDVLASGVDENQKALAQERIDEIENERLIAEAEKKLAADEAELEKKIALIKLAVKKRQLEAEFNVKLEELKADEAIAIAGTSDIFWKEDRDKAKKEIKSAYGAAYAAIGKGASATAGSLELERSAITGSLTEADFEDVNSFASTALNEAQQPITITLDGKVIASSTNKYISNNLIV